MSKYIIDIPKTVGMGEVGSVHYTYFDGIQCKTIVIKSDEIEELNSDYINEHFGDLQDTAYQRGLDDAWEAARKIVEMADPPYWGVFNEYKNDLFGKISAAEAIAKLKVYEEKQKAEDEIKVMDEVVWTEDENVVIVVTCVYTADNMEWCDGVRKDGKVYSILTDNARKTGRHFNIATILEDMRND